MESVIPSYLVDELRAIELRTSHRIKGLRAGSYTSPRLGDGLDFDQHRPYRPGDDIRRIDWNATARTGLPFIRQAKTDRELNIVLAGDLSRSMQFGSGRRSKHDALVLAMACLLFSALQDQIAVGVLGFTDRILDWTAPISNRVAAWAALTRLWTIQAKSKETALGPALQHLLQSLKRTTLVVLLSDFQINEDAMTGPELTVLASRHDVVAVVLEDPAEGRLPAGSGFVRLRDLESGREVTVGLSDQSRNLYTHLDQERRRRLRDLFFRCGVDHVFIDSQMDVVEPLLRVFAGRTS